MFAPDDFNSAILRAPDRSDALVGVEPSNLEAQHVAIVLLRSLDIQDRQFGDR
jgi:hypothetical protein